MFKIKNKNGTRDENSSAQRMFQKKNFNYKIKTYRRERSTGKVQNRDVRDENLRV
jgi:hypothetical protein